MIIETFFQDQVKLIKLNNFVDDRGSFLQTYDEKISSFVNENIVQENVSFSKKNVARGLHYQWQQPMGKLIQCLNGKIIDLFLDIRISSPYYGQVHFVKLTEPSYLLWIPAGFAHGFISLEENTIVKYMCSSLYNKDGEGCINLKDPQLKLSEKIQIDLTQLIFSDKDFNAQNLQNYTLQPKF